jgi:hypothetical protein
MIQESTLDRIIVRRPPENPDTPLQFPREARAG